jgi:hypothetical protein
MRRINYKRDNYKGLRRQNKIDAIHPTAFLMIIVNWNVIIKQNQKFVEQIKKCLRLIYNRTGWNNE